MELALYLIKAKRVHTYGIELLVATINLINSIHIEFPNPNAILVSTRRGDENIPLAELKSLKPHLKIYQGKVFDADHCAVLYTKYHIK